MELINSLNSFNSSFNSNSIQKQKNLNSQTEIIKSFSRNFNSNINIKSNVQKKNNTIAVIKKKSA